VLIGVGHTPEEVRKPSEVARPIRLEMVQRLERLAERRELVLLRCSLTESTLHHAHAPEKDTASKRGAPKRRLSRP
jgi:hypothetical protein